MVAQLTRLVVEYIGTFFSLARSEAGHDLTHLAGTLKRWAFAAVAAILGLLWLNIALLLWLMQSPWRVGGALAVGVALFVAAWALTRSKLTGPTGVLAHTRELARAEMHAMGLDGRQADPMDAARSELSDATRSELPPADHAAPRRASPPMTPTIARARLKLTRNRIGQALAPAEPVRPAQPAGSASHPRAQPRPAASVQAGFVPRSQTMRLLLDYWGGRPERGTFGTIAGSLLGFVVLRNRRLRRIAAMIGMARNVSRVLGRRLRRN